jgi:cysteinyl-tRNA synthetase
MDDDFSTAKVLANMFELTPVINSFKDGLIKKRAITAAAMEKMQQQFRIYIEDIFGLKNTSSSNNNTLSEVMQLLISIRKEAKEKKDYATSDKIRKQLLQIGIELKDEKDGSVNWTL